MALLNTTRDKKERVGRMLLMHANNREEIKEAYAGDIVALAGLKDIAHRRHAVRSAEAGDPREDGVPRPGHRDGDRAEDQGRPGEDRRRARASSRPRIRRSASRPTRRSGQTILKGMGELHLDIKVDILKRTYKVEANVGAPQVAYRETITRAAEIDYTHKKQTGGTGQFARVKLVVEPNEPGEGYEFENEDRRRHGAEGVHPGRREGRRVACSDAGVLAGFPVVDIKVTLIDGAYHDVDSSALAFEIAARAALREGLQKAGPELLEPIMKVEVVTPEDYIGGVIGDLNSPARPDPGPGHARQRQSSINAMVPLANMFGYISTAALDDPGPRDLHHAVRPLRGGAAQRGRRGQGEVRLSRQLHEQLTSESERIGVPMAKAKFERTKPH